MIERHHSMRGATNVFFQLATVHRLDFRCTTLALVNYEKEGRSGDLRERKSLSSRPSASKYPCYSPRSAWLLTYVSEKGA